MNRMQQRLALVLTLVGFLSACGGDGGATVDEAMSESALDAPNPDPVPTYTLDSSWPPALPNDWAMGVPTSVSVDPRDHVWVLHRPRTVPEGAEENAAPAGLGV